MKMILNKDASIISTASSKKDRSYRENMFNTYTIDQKLKLKWNLSRNNISRFYTNLIKQIKNTGFAFNQR
jgi:hypothetical protein